MQCQLHNLSSLTQPHSTCTQAQASIVRREHLQMTTSQTGAQELAGDNSGNRGTIEAQPAASPFAAHARAPRAGVRQLASLKGQGNYTRIRLVPISSVRCKALHAAGCKRSLRRRATPSARAARRPRSAVRAVNTLPAEQPLFYNSLAIGMRMLRSAQGRVGRARHGTLRRARACEQAVSRPGLCGCAGSRAGAGAETSWEVGRRGGRRSCRLPLVRACGGG
jgi:hypothetical protein